MSNLSNTNNKKIISIVVPTHNEQLNIVPLYEKIVSVFKAIDKYDFELIFTDDSEDETPKIISLLVKNDRRVNLIRLSRKFGQAIAIVAGLEKCNGVAAIMMDADLQDPPEAIINLIEKWELGHQIVMVKRSSENKGFIYSIGSRYFYKILYKISDIKVPVGVGEFRLIDRKVIDVMNTLKEKTRFLRGLTIWPGFSSATIEIERKKRLTGETKYNLLKSLSVAVDGFISFSIAPLRATVIMGLIMFIIALIGILYAITLRLTTESWVSGWTLLFVSIMFLGGMQFIILGIIGEYIGRIFLEVLDRPLYVIDYEIGEINKR